MAKSQVPPVTSEQLWSLWSLSNTLPQSHSKASRAEVLTFLMLQPSNTVPHVVVTHPPNHELISLLLCNCNFATVANHFATVANHNVNIWYAGYLACNPL